MRKYSGSLILTIIFSSLFSISTIQSSQSAPPSDTAKSISAYDQYKKECLKRVNQKGLSASDGEKLCNCAITKFRTSYDINQFKTLLEKSKTDKKVQNILNAVGEACFDEILFES